MLTKVFKADTIDTVVKEILDELRGSENVIYFDGWDGLGASAVLQAVAERLAVSSKTKFEKIIHIDCSKWESRRAMQREIAKQLNLPNRVMEILDKQDEEDDFNGLGQDSRGEIQEVVRETNLAVLNRRCLVILHNGSNEEIDIFHFGLSLYTYVNNSKMLWTFQGRFRLDPEMIDIVKKSTKTNLVLSASRYERDPHELWSYLLHHEAAHVVCDKNGHGIIDPAIAAQCVMYMLKQCRIRSHIIEYDWGIHTCNYWLCDGIIIPQGVETEIDKAWQVGDALQHEMHMDWTKESSPYSHLARFTEKTPYWISTATCGFVLSPSGIIPGYMFQHSDRLGVLKLSSCSFSFSSPPFLCCSILRFLWLDRCQDIRSTDAEKREEEEDTTSTRSWACFQSLWVLDLRYTDWDLILSAQVMDLMTQLRELNVMGAKNWDMSHLRGWLRNIRKLRVTKSTCCFNNNVFSEMKSLELLDFSGNHITQGMTNLSGPAGSGSLETFIVDGCDELKTISLRGCKELKNLLLKGFFWKLEELDLSGTGVKTLKLEEVKAPVLKRLILLGCEKLVAVNPHRINPDVIKIDTTSTSASADESEAPHAHTHGDRSLQRQKEEKFNQWQFSLADARLLWSLSVAIKSLRDPLLHIDICPAATLDGSNDKSSDKLVQVTSTMVGCKYTDVLKDGPIAEIMMWECPEIYSRPSQAEIYSRPLRSCIIKVITQGQGNKLSEDALLLDDSICNLATSLHVYDNSSITSIPAPPGGSDWKNLRWCRVERCPKLHTLFPSTRTSLNWSYFSDLDTLWVSQLPTARYIWDDAPKVNNIYYIHPKFLHLDCCPRLIHVVRLPMDTSFWHELETLEIVCCGDLREVFPLVKKHIVVREVFPNLKRIHLHELPMLQHICPEIFAPNLETIKIRGCWSLRRLPSVGSDTKLPMVDCEKEWWDNLEWDGVEVNHHPFLYEPSHPSHYKNAQLPKGTLLR